jgi:hypothetical protein
MLNISNTLAHGAVTASQVEQINFLFNTRTDRKKTSWSVTPEGRVNVSGPIKGDDFARGGRFNVAFGTVNTTIFSVNNVFSLEDGPEQVLGVFDVRSPYLTTLVGGPSITSTYHVEANALKTLAGVAKQADTLKVVSSGLTSLSGLASYYEAGHFAQCSGVKTTNGLKATAFASLELPGGLHEVTELPKSCLSVYATFAHECKGVSKLFMINDLTNFSLGSTFDVAKRALINVLREHPTPVARRLAAEQVFIDYDLEAYL